MATTTGPDLSTAKTKVEELMDDTCTLTRPVTVEHLNPETGKLETVEPTPYYSDQCKFRPRAGTGTATEGGTDKVRRQYDCAVILGTDVREGDEFILTSTRRDTEVIAVGIKFKVIEVLYSTFAVQRKFVVEVHG